MMNFKFKPFMKNLGIFLVGLIVGAFIMESLEIYVRPKYRQVIAINLKVDEEFLAGRAKREGKPFEEVLHRWAAVSAESENGFRSFYNHSDGFSDQSYFFPFALVISDRIWSPEKLKRGAILVESQDHGKLALALEAISQTEEAEKQWELAQQLTPSRRMDEVKRSAHSLLELEKTELHRQAEKAVLGN